MGTRALFKTYDISDSGELDEIATIYVQCDGYPDGWGLIVAEFLASKKLVNGIPFGHEGEVFNGMDDLTAQLITYMKMKLATIRGRKNTDSILAGTVYVMKAGTSKVGEEYVYHIYPEKSFADELDFTLRMRCNRKRLYDVMMKVEDVYGKQVIFDGKASEFIDFVKKIEEEEAEAPQI